MLKLRTELYEVWSIQRNANWIELEKPYKDGYYKIWDLRDDIKNRSDAWVFYECIKLVGQRAWYKNKSFKRKLRKGKYEYINASMGEISKDKYDSLHPAVKKYFSPISEFSLRWNPLRPIYECRVPSYYFVEKIIPRWVTHYQEFDAVLAQKEAELNDKLCNTEEWYQIAKWRGSAPKDFCKTFHRSDRKHSKQTLKRNIDAGGDCDKYEYRYHHKHGARWMYW